MLHGRVVKMYSKVFMKYSSKVKGIDLHFLFTVMLDIEVRYMHVPFIQNYMIQSDAVIKWSNIKLYCIRHCSYWVRLPIRVQTNKTHPITHPNGWARGVISEDYRQNWPCYNGTALYFYVFCEDLHSDASSTVVSFPATWHSLPLVPFPGYQSFYNRWPVISDSYNRYLFWTAGSSTN